MYHRQSESTVKTLYFFTFGEYMAGLNAVLYLSRPKKREKPLRIQHYSPKWKSNLHSTYLARFLYYKKNLFYSVLCYIVTSKTDCLTCPPKHLSGYPHTHPTIHLTVNRCLTKSVILQRQYDLLRFMGMLNILKFDGKWGMECLSTRFPLPKKWISFTLYPAHSRVCRRDPVLRHGSVKC